jgi:poly(3-hydroxybutyrate) depolymerase
MVVLLLTVLLASDPSAISQGTGAARPPDVPPPLVLRDALVLPPVGNYGRSAIHTDLLESQIVAGKWRAPKSGEQITLPNGEVRTWEKASTDKGGTLRGRALAGGYVFWSVPSTAEKVMLLEAAGHAMVYVNGEPRGGDIYSHGYVTLPVQLRAGTNDFLFHVARGQLRARLLPADKSHVLHKADALLPDLIEGELSHWGAVVVINASKEPLAKAVVEVEGPDLKALRTVVSPLPPLSVRKVPFRVGQPIKHVKACKAEVRLLVSREGQMEVLDRMPVEFALRRPTEPHRRTFLSKIDGSVQYFAVLPAQPLSPSAPPPGLVLTLHGASVEASGQAAAYSAKTWTHIVAPTNRRPFGFDWEDWGRQDALEVLDLAQQILHTDKQRTYLTGHSMGGHGVWHVGATFPDRFAAIGPSAGWATFWSYAGAQRPEPSEPVLKLLRRAGNSSDTLGLARNYLHHGVYVLHGEDDDNVLVREARLMRDTLSKFHKDLAYHEQPKAGHWWDASPEPGTDCVDWAPMFDLFARRMIPANETVRHVEFITANPGISARSHWASIEAQIKPLEFGSVNLRYDPGLRRFSGTSDNVARLALDLSHVRPGTPVQVELDGQKIKDVPWPRGELRLWLRREGDQWQLTTQPAPDLKGPHRYGPFREAFTNRMLFVYGTKGTPEENAWAYNKARFDAEQFWYRGNGSVDLLADTNFALVKYRDRNVILYGNADTNAAWPLLLAKCPLQVKRGSLTAGQHKLTGEDLACLFVRPRPDSATASVGVVSGTGLPGLRLTDRCPLFLSGAAYPDLLVFGPEMLIKGPAGIRAAGYFGIDWGVETGEVAWREP